MERARERASDGVERLGRRPRSISSQIAVSWWSNRRSNQTAVKSHPNRPPGPPSIRRGDSGGPFTSPGRERGMGFGVRAPLGDQGGAVCRLVTLHERHQRPPVPGPQPVRAKERRHARRHPARLDPGLRGSPVRRERGCARVGRVPPSPTSSSFPPPPPLLALFLVHAITCAALAKRRYSAGFSRRAASCAALCRRSPPAAAAAAAAVVLSRNHHEGQIRMAAVASLQRRRPPNRAEDILKSTG